ncbi:MAG: alanine--tRNA ligase [Clostridia bacterium]|nr:alanine--tRNA ligase [Clostridia bacterium]MDD4686262.1 alanine--tRNA ligase [Clostridia bacterium]
MLYSINDVKNLFLEFFVQNQHKQIKNSSIVPENDESLLFINAGMTPIKKVFTGEQIPESNRMCNIQTCIRTNDIDSIGDMHHLSSFCMLGSWSIGDYFKEGAINFAYDFLINKLKLPKEKIYVTIFSGDSERKLPADTESEELWQKAGMPKNHILLRPFSDNFWRMGDGESPCGPCTEVFFDTENKSIKSYEESGFFDDKQRYIEIWNAGVFMQYLQHEDGSYTRLKTNSVDTGAGIERMTMVLNGLKNVYETQAYASIIQLLKNNSTSNKENSYRIISDHIRTSVYIINAGVEASNLKRGYVLRRLLRRAMRHLRAIGVEDEFLKTVVESTIDNLNECGLNPNWLFSKQQIVQKVLIEQEKFSKLLVSGLKTFNEFIASEQNIENGKLNSKLVFKLYDTFGFPFEITKELAEENNLSVDEAEFNVLLENHKELSKGKTGKVYKSGLADTSEQSVKLHTATHLLHYALKKVLGNHINQKGSNITSDRLRFDFNFERKMTEEEVRQVEELVNQVIEKEIPVVKEEMNLEDAKNSGAIGLFDNRYGDKVTVYTIGTYSKELCAGPHVNNTKELVKFKITKEESSSAGVRRIRAILQ